MWKRGDEARRKSRALWRVNLAGLVALLLLAAAMAWLMRHPEVQPRGGYAPVAAHAYR